MESSQEDVAFVVAEFLESGTYYTVCTAHQYDGTIYPIVEDEEGLGRLFNTPEEAKFYVDRYHNPPAGDLGHYAYWNRKGFWEFR